MQPDPQPIPTPIPKRDPLSVRLMRRPLRRALLHTMAIPLTGGTRDARRTPQRILLIRPDHLGDLLFVTPALAWLRAQLPDAHITLLVGPWAKPLLAHNPHIDELQTLDFPGFTRRPKASPLAPYRLLRDAARTLRAQSFDLAIVLRFDHWWGAWLAALAGIPMRVGYAVPEVKPFLTDVVPYEPGRHEVAQNVRLMARALGVSEPVATPQNFPLHFPLAQDDERVAADLLQAHQVGARFAVLVPGSGAAVKLWRAESFARVADDLHAQHDLDLVVVGSADEAPLAARIAALAQARIINLAGQTTLPQLGALLARAALAVGTDSGPMHLAVAMHTPSVHLFGPVSARAFGPWGDPTRHVALTSGLACIPCNRLDYSAAEIPAHPCVPLIAERQVLAAAAQVLRAVPVL